MKTVEEKAKAYDAAIKKAESLYKASEPMSGCNVIIETLFPELKESEDERIRKWLIAQLKIKIGDNATLNNMIYKAIAWLEKQGNIDKASYEIAEKEKREFVGDGFIKCYDDFQDFKEGETYWLEYVGNDNYNVRSDNLLGKTYHITPCQLYTIFKKMTWLEKQGEHKPTLRERYKNIAESEWFKKTHEGMSVSDDEKVDNINKVEPKFKVGDWIIYSEEEVDLITGFDDNGYFVDKEGYIPFYCEGNMRLFTIQDAKELKKIEQNFDLNEEDKKLTNVNHEYFSELLENNNSKNINDYAYQVAYCMSHDWANEIPTWDDVQKACKLGAEWKEKHCNNSSNTWNEEDEHRIKLLEALCENKLFENVPNSTTYEEMKITIDWLKSLRRQSKQEWSKEDDELITAAICFIDNYNHDNGFACNGIYKADVSKWLLSLKERIIG